jgi:hypothetical protein
MNATIVLKSLEDLQAQDFAGEGEPGQSDAPEVLTDGHLEAQEPPRSLPISRETVSYRHWGINE